MGLFDPWPLDWGDLERSQRLPDHDVVSVEYTDIAADTSEFELELANPVTWYKAVQVLNDTNGELGIVQCQDNNTHDGPISVPSGDIITGGHLILWKAKLFGVHTAVYVLADLEHVQGKRVKFRWIAD
jgi:hypothetical protein